MRIVHFAYSDLIEGAAQAGFRLHSELRHLGVDSRMVVSRKLGDDPMILGPSNLLERAWSAASFELDILPKRIMYVLPDSIQTEMPPDSALACVGSRRINEVLRLSPDIVQLHWICGGLVTPAGLSKLGNTRIVWRLADMWPFCGSEHYSLAMDRVQNGYTRQNRPEGHRGFDYDRWVFNRKLRAYRRLKNLTIVAPSSWIARAAERSLLFRDRRIEVIHTGIDIRTFRPEGPQSPRLTRDQAPPLVLVGSARPRNPRKGLVHAAAALSNLLASGVKSFRVGVFGSDMPLHFKNLDCEVIFLGSVSRRSEMAAIYRAADVFVAPSLHENLANTVLEALGCGTPVVTYGAGGMTDAVEHMKNGYVAEVENTHDLASGIRLFVEADQEMRARFRENARSIALSRFDQRDQARKYLTLYNELTGIQ